ncbi:MAG: AtpZ/AtpI family protein [Pseudomonadota bacterium]
MPAEPDPDRLATLEARIAQAKGEDEPVSRMGESHRQGQLAWRMVIELVAGLAIGFGMGYGLDTLFGTTPWLMLIFTVLGFVAGVKTMIRSAAEVQNQMAGDAPPDREDETRGE